MPTWSLTFWSNMAASRLSVCADMCGGAAPEVLVSTQDKQRGKCPNSYSLVRRRLLYGLKPSLACKLWTGPLKI